MLSWVRCPRVSAYRCFAGTGEGPTTARNRSGRRGRAGFRAPTGASPFRAAGPVRPRLRRGLVVSGVGLWMGVWPVSASAVCRVQGGGRAARGSCCFPLGGRGGGRVSLGRRGGLEGAGWCACPVAAEVAGGGLGGVRDGLRRGGVTSLLRGMDTGVSGGLFPSGVRMLWSGGGAAGGAWEAASGLRSSSGRRTGCRVWSQTCSVVDRGCPAGKRLQARSRVVVTCSAAGHGLGVTRQGGIYGARG